MAERAPGDWQGDCSPGFKEEGSGIWSLVLAPGQGGDPSRDCDTPPHPHDSHSPCRLHVASLPQSEVVASASKEQTQLVCPPQRASLSQFLLVPLTPSVSRNPVTQQHDFAEENHPWLIAHNPEREMFHFKRKEKHPFFQRAANNQLLTRCHLKFTDIGSHSNPRELSQPALDTDCFSKGF